MINMKIYLGQCDLYFMVQSFCLLIRGLLDGEMSYSI